MSDEMNKVLSDSIDSIEPADGAKERMLSNIKKKAEMQRVEETQKTAQESAQKNNKIIKFNRVVRWAAPIAACFVIALVGVSFLKPGKTVTPADSQSTEQGGNDFVSNGNPSVQVDSADEIKAQLGITIDAPANAKDITYSIIDESIAEVYFLYEDNYYAIRASKQSGDFSGIDGDVIKEEQIDSRNNAVLENVSTLEGYLYRIRWTDGEINYFIANWDAASKDAMISLYEKIQK